MKIIIILIVSAYVAYNMATAVMFSNSEMADRYINGQCFVGKILVNIFYAPAWLLKLVKIVVNFTIK